MMTDPKQPAPPPDNGVPPGAGKADAKGMPTSDRQQTETAASPEKHKPD